MERSVDGFWVTAADYDDLESKLRDRLASADDLRARIEALLTSETAGEDPRFIIDQLRKTLFGDIVLSKTHNSECYRWHHACAIALVEQLKNKQCRDYERAIAQDLEEQVALRTSDRNAAETLNRQLLHARDEWLAADIEYRERIAELEAQLKK